MDIEKAIVASNHDPFYLDFWPIVRDAWLDLEITPVLVLIGEEDNTVEDHGGIIHQIKAVNGFDTGFQAQISRMYITKLYQDSVCISSDIDMLPISYDYFHSLGDYSNDSMVILSSDAYEWAALQDDWQQVLYPGLKKFPICYNAATGSTYNEILDLSCSFEDYCHRVKLMKKTMIMWMNKNVEPSLSKWNSTDIKGAIVPLDQESSYWDSDECYFAQKINDFENQDRIIKLTRGWENNTAPNRIDRGNWSYDDNKIDQYIDSHMLRPLSEYHKEILELTSLIRNKRNEHSA